MKPFQLQFITNPLQGFSALEQAEAAVKGGCRWVQLRMKETPVEEVNRQAADICRLCHENGAVFIVDDYPEVARNVRADGVHLGRNDMPVADARKLLGPNFIIGGTANTLGDICQLAHQGANYIGCGPFRFTTTKKNLAPTLHLHGYQEIIDGMKREGIDLPLVAIGGIVLDDLPHLFSAGVRAVAVSGSIVAAEHPTLYVGRLIGKIDRLSHEHTHHS